MYALSFSAEGDCYRCVPPDPGIAATALGASASGTPPSTAPAEVLQTFTLDSGVSRCFFRDSTTLTPLTAPVPIRLADPSGDPVVASSSTVLPCPAGSLGSLSGSRLLLVSPPVAPDSSVAPPPGSPIPATPSWHALPSPCLWSPQVSASLTVLACPALSSLRQGAAAPRSSLLLVPADDCSLVDPTHGLRLQLRERFGQEIPVLRLHSNKGGEFSSDILRDFCRGEGITQSFTLPDSPQQNGIAERRIGLLMEVARTSMIHVAAPLFLWPFAVRYAAHQLNLWPRVSLPETSPTLRWTRKVGDASVFRSYHPTLRRVLPSHDITFDESVPFYRLFPYRSAPPPPPPLFLASGPPQVDPLLPQGPTPSGVSQVDPLPGTAPVQVAVVSGAAPGAASGGAEPGGAGFEGAGSRGAEPEGVEPGGAESEGAGSWGAEARGASSSGDPAGASPRLSSQQLREWLVWRPHRRSGAPGAGGVGDTGAGGAAVSTGADGTSGVWCAGAGDPTEPGAARILGTGAGVAGVGGPRAGGAGAAGAGVGGTGAGGTGAAGGGAVDPGAGGASHTVRPRPYFIPLLQQVLGVPSTGLPPPFLCPPPDQSQPRLQPASPLPTPSPYTEQSGSLTESREPASRPVLPFRTPRRAPHSRPPLVPGTHAMALCPSSIPQRVPLPAPPESSLLEVPDPESDRVQAASPTAARLLATAVIDLYFESAAASALVAQLLDFAAACRLDYATALVAEFVSASPPSVGGECALGTDVLEDRQEDFECLAAAVPLFASLVLAPEGDTDAPDIPTPHSYAEGITGTSKLGEQKESGVAAQKQHKGEENPKAAAEEEYGDNMWGTIASAAFSNPTSATGECDWLTMHRRMGHVALPILQQLVKNVMVSCIRVKGEPDEVLGCPTCMQAKFCRYPFSCSEATAKAPPDEVVMDVVGPLKLGAAGAEYFLTNVDVYTRMNWVYVLSKKSDVAETVKTDWLPMVERQQDRLVKAIRTDRGGEFLSKEFSLWLKKNDIRHSLTMPYSPAMNGIFERANRTITETARGLLIEAGLPDYFWPDAVRSACVAKNRALTHVGADKWVPYVEWIERKPKVNMLRVFGCMCMALVPKHLVHNKLGAKAIWAEHLGMAQNSNGWLL
ncbi:unnamed protein product [Closterium sp. NIES-54]